jgi:hypothetical protein
MRPIGFQSPPPPTPPSEHQPPQLACFEARIDLELKELYYEDRHTKGKKLPVQLN